MEFVLILWYKKFMDENKDSYFDMIFQILDYRNWFTFKLFYRKNQSERKELTDKVFSVFSGGEKAKTMYVPLFASVYAKLDSASLSALEGLDRRKDCCFEGRAVSAKTI